MQSYTLGRLTLARQACGRAMSTTVPLVSTVHGDPSSSTTPLIMAHGLFGQKQNFRTIAKNINEKTGATVHCVDLRNHGDSPHATGMTYEELSTDLIQYIRKIQEKSGVKKVHVLGHSMGGKTAMRLALRPDGQELIDRLIIEDASPRGNKTHDSGFIGYIRALKKLDLHRPRKNLLDDLAPGIPDLPLRQFFLTNLQKSKDDPSKMEWKCNLDALEHYVRDILGEGLTGSDGTFSGDTLFLRGELSDFFTDKDEPLVRNLFPKVRFETIPNARHWVHSDQPRAFVESVCNFLQH
ncbi:unnamed protein product [Caenorhabditis auriculariae]|uniref:sn-1-specific diacylglycerol lipase ABHD11 n=1 Tax=Caenorhabditis auriculariae TaxID=2777116 RepID=A0A8S1HC28_9PELO|nr:unnamed protein product [Caenorhabditis auriculariae]